MIRRVPPCMRLLPCSSAALLRSTELSQTNYLKMYSTEEKLKKFDSWERLKPNQDLVESSTQEATLEYKSVAKGMVLNKFDKSNLVFPEFAETEEPIELEGYVTELEAILEKFEPHISPSDRELPEDLLNELRALGLFAMLVPKQYGGLTLNGRPFSQKDYVRVQEILSRNLSLYTTVSVHELVVTAILKFGSDSQKIKYLPKLASGELAGAFCIMENKSGLDHAGSEMSYTKELAKSHVKLNGTKSWVTNAARANLFLVFAKLKSSHSTTDPELLPMTAFLVDKAETSGDEIVLEKRRDPLGLQAANFWDVSFKNTSVPLENMLSGEASGFEVASAAMDEHRYAMGALASGFLKRSLGPISERGNREKRFAEVLSENASFKKRVFDISINAFVLESMSYYVAGKKDEFKHKDLSLEGQCINRFARKALNDGVLSSVNLLGAGSLEDAGQKQALADVLTLSFFMSNPDFLTESIGLSAIQTWAQFWAEDVAKLRKPDEGVWRVLSRNLSMRNKRKLSDPFKSTHFLFESVHPSLEGACKDLEKMMANLELAFSDTIEHYGQSVETEGYVLERLAESVTLAFAMAATISRSSRSYCIGLANSEIDIHMCHVFCSDAERRTRHLLEELLDMRVNVEEDNLKQKIAKATLLDGGYPVSNPLQRNWQHRLGSCSIMVNVKKGVLITCDPAMKMFLRHLDDSGALGTKFILHDLDETHLLVDPSIVGTLQEKIDTLMDSLSPDLAEK